MKKCSDRSFNLFLISAWNDSGGGFMHRLFDGHPELYTYPFEMQFGTDQLNDGFNSWFHKKYRWLSLNCPLDQLAPEAIFDAIIDQELKSTIQDQSKSKFCDFLIDINSKQWRIQFEYILSMNPISRKSIVESYLISFFDQWNNRVKSNVEHTVLGHCPVIIVDADKIIHDFPLVKIIHIFRSPLSGFADIRYRRPSISVESYCKKWNLINSMAIAFEKKYPNNVKCVHYSDVLIERKAVLSKLCVWLEIEFSTITLQPTWNTQPLFSIYPFGGVRTISEEHEDAYKSELSMHEQETINRCTFGVQSLMSTTISQNQRSVF